MPLTILREGDLNFVLIMRQLKAFVLVFVISVLTSCIVTIVGLYTASKIRPPSPGNFRILEGFQAAFLAGIIYGGTIGIAIGFVSSIFYIGFVQSMGDVTRAIWIITAFSFLVGIVECIFYLADNHVVFFENEPILLYLFVSGFLTAFVPLFVTKVRCKL